MSILTDCFPGPTDFYLADPKKTTIKQNGGIRWAVDREFRIPLDQALEGHLNGTLNKGVVLPPLVWNEKKKRFECDWGAIDIDGNIYKDDKFKKEILKKIQDTPFVACFSKSKGLHLIIRFSYPTDAELVIKILHSYLKKFGLPEDTECFPKQFEKVKMGNGIMLPFMKDKGNDWIKSFDDKGYTTGNLIEFKHSLFSKRVNAEDIKIEIPPKEKLNGSTPNDFDKTQTGLTKLEILKKIKDGTIKKHPTMGGKYHSWIQVVIGKCVKEGYGDNEILKLIKEVHQDKRGLGYTHPDSYQKMINYTRKDNRYDKVNPGDTKKLGEKSVLDNWVDEENERDKQGFFDDTIYIKFDDRWYSKKTGLEYKEKTIKVANGHLFDKDVIKEFSNDEERKQEVETGVYRPDLFNGKDDPIIIDEDELPQLNIYRPGGPEGIPADTEETKKELQMFKDLVWKLTEKEKSGWTDKKVELPLYDYVMDHLTMPFKYRGEKVRSTILLHSEFNQLGKSTVFEVVQRGLGKNNCIVITPENACRREKAFLQKQLVLIDEILIDGDYKKKKSVLNVLKPLMTADKHDCRPLFKESRQVYSTCNFMLSTNHKEAVAITEHDARYTCIDVNKTREEMGGDKFFRPLWKALKLGTLVPVVKHYLENRELSETFDPAGISLKTNFIKVMAEHGGHPIFTSIKTDIAQREEPFRYPIVSISEAHDFYGKKGTKGSLNELADALKRMKCVRLGECSHKPSGKAPILYVVRDFDFFKPKDKSEIARDFWLPIDVSNREKVGLDGSTKYDMSKFDVINVKTSLKKLNPDYIPEGEKRILNL